MATSPPPGRRGVSETLRRFTEEFPYERGPILDFVIRVAEQTPPAARVLDVGAGNAPYRELFAHAEYLTLDWAASEHAGATGADIVGSADDLPVEAGSLDLILCTQVLEHVPEPGAVLNECARVLVSGGRLALTAPLLWEQHEMPYDYYRYTESGLRYLLTRAGLVDLDIRARGNAFTAIAQLLVNVSWMVRRQADPLNVQASATLQGVADEVARLAPLDVDFQMPLGFTATASKP